MAASEVLAQGQQPPLRERIRLRERGERQGSAMQMLWSKLEATASLHQLCRQQQGLFEEAQVILALCAEKLEMARRCIDRKWLRSSFAFWPIIHEVDSLLLLVMPASMLLPEALEIQHRFEQKVKDPLQRRLWLGEPGKSGPLVQAVRSLGGRSEALDANLSVQSLSQEQLRYCRHVLRGALDLVNTQADKGFWQLSVNVTIQILSTLLLLAFSAAAFALPAALVTAWRDMLVPWALMFFSLAGAAGAIVSNMLSRQRCIVTAGATIRYFIYYLLVKPVIGAFAALLLVLLEQSRILLAVVVAPRASVPAAAADMPVTVPYLPGVAPLSAPAATPTVAPATDAPITALVQLVVDSESAAFFALAALAVAVGFSADRMLSSMMDRVLSRLWRQSENMGPPAPHGDRPPVTS
jgi:hypothetical protein